jgi:hypothetical protein
MLKLVIVVYKYILYRHYFMCWIDGEIFANLLLFIFFISLFVNEISKEIILHANDIDVRAVRIVNSANQKYKFLIVLFIKKIHKPYINNL